MSVITQNHILNIVPGMSAPVVVHVSQGDSGVELEFVLVNGSEIFDPTGTVISVHGIRQDGTGWGPVACAREDGKIKFTLPDAATAVKGSGMAELSISNGEETVGTTNFAILVETATFPQGVTYANDVSVYEAILAYVDQMGEQTVANVEADLAAEIANRQAADAVLQQNINSEASTRAGADTTLQTNLNNAVSSLNEALANEASTRQNADSSEASTRSSADANLQAQIDQLVAPSGEAPSAAEVENARIGADGVIYNTLGNAIRGQINNLSSNTRNLFNVNGISKTGITISDGVMSGTASAFTDAFKSTTAGIAKDVSFEADTRYTVSFKAKCTGSTSGYGLVFSILYTDESTPTTMSVSNAYSNYTQLKLTSNANKTISKIVISYQSNGSNVWYLKDFQIEKGTDKTDFIPFISAVDYVIRENVENNNNTISNLCYMNSKNVFSKTFLQTSGNVTCELKGDGYVELNGSDSSFRYFDIATTIASANLEPGKEYWLEYDSPAVSISSLSIYFNIGTGLSLAYDGLIGVNKIKIPTNIVTGNNGIIIRLNIRANAIFSNTKYRLTISEDKSNYTLAENSADFKFLESWGTGDCTLIKFLDGTVMAIDFGYAEIQHTIHRSWKRAVTDMNITHIDYAVISHYHGDHIGLLIDENTSAEDYVDMTDYIDSDTTFFLPNGHAFTQEELEALAWIDEVGNEHLVSNYTKVMTFLNNVGAKIVYPTENMKWRVGGSEIQFWNADQTWIMDKFIAHETYDYNEASLCCYVTIGEQRICFSGDIGKQAMDRFKTAVLSSQLYKANHHAVGYGVVPTYLNSLMPNVIITILGYGLAINDDMLSASELQAWCESNNVPNVVTGINDKTLTLRVSEDGYSWVTSCRQFVCGNGNSFIEQCQNDFYVFTCVDKPISIDSSTGLFIFGDSIVTDTHGGFTWASLIASKFGCTEYNYGVGAARFNTTTSNNILNQVNNVPDWEPCDIAIIAAGTNELIDGALEPTNLRDEVEDVINAIKTNAPNAKIVFITPIKRANYTYYKISQIAGIIANTALINGCSVINGAEFPIILTSDANDSLIAVDDGDSVHPNSYGKHIYAQSVLNAML